MKKFCFNTYVAYMVVDYWLSCKELTALQSCRKKKLYKILIRLLVESTRSPPGVHLESIWIRGGVSVTAIRCQLPHIYQPSWQSGYAARKKCDYIIINGVVWGSTPHVAFCFWLWKSHKSQSPPGVHTESIQSPHRVYVKSTWSPPQPVRECHLQLKHWAQLLKKLPLSITKQQVPHLIMFKDPLIKSLQKESLLEC